MKCPHCNKEIKETLEIPELKIKITKVIHHGKSYNEIMKLKKKDERLLELEEVKIIINNKIISDWLEIYNIQNDFFFKQPIELNKLNGKVARFYASFDRATLDCRWCPSDTNSVLGVIFAEDLK